MTTDVIDPSIHGGSLPTNYIGDGTIAGNCIQSGGIDSILSGFFTSDGNATLIKVGFKPTKITVMNSTDGIRWEWMYGMPAADSVKIVLGGSLAGTLDTGSAFTITSDPAGNQTVTLSATLCGSAKNIGFRVEG